MCHYINLKSTGSNLFDAREVALGFSPFFLFAGSKFWLRQQNSNLLGLKQLFNQDHKFIAC